MRTHQSANGAERQALQAVANLLRAFAGQARKKLARFPSHFEPVHHRPHLLVDKVVESNGSLRVQLARCVVARRTKS